MLIRYICEICRAQYNTPESAELCEARGAPMREQCPVGLIIGGHYPSSGLYLIQAVGATDVSGHGRGVYYWTWNDRLRPDGSVVPAEIGDDSLQIGQYTGGSLYPNPLVHFGEPNYALPAYARAYHDLIVAGITPTVRKDGKVVPAPAPQETP